MNDFEYLFSFYALLLGLSVANVASGFGDMWRERHAMPIGVCTPLLGLVVLAGGMNIWVRFWHTQHDVHFSPWWLLSAVGVTVPFIFVSRAMFPTPSEPKSLEDHYMEQRKVLLLALTVPPCVSAASNILAGNLYSGWPGVWMTLRVAAPLTLIPFNSRMVQRIGLSLFVALLVLGMFRW
jgi:hypothetical protein